MKKYEKDREAFVLEYLPLVRRIAQSIHRHVYGIVDIRDLIGYGVLAILESINKLDKTKNPEAYLRLRIRGAMYDYLRSLDFVSRSLRDKAKRIRQALEELSKEKEPTDEEIAKYLDVSVEDLHKDLQKLSASQILYLDEIFKEGRSYEEIFSSSEETPEDIVIREDLEEKLKEAIERLNDREKLVLQLVFYEELPIKEVAKILGVSMARVSQIKEDAIEKIRKYLISVL
ncbi:sigma-70 family RNA polymerase sigma factor [Thermocrinis minervae]|uniref:RNA polymerase, sigma 28 subunit, SigD/FliA/WhiG n=1 Tax=Thermocrinis minervae TaxID=381751 RepID=A0A1M6REP0_9AQUI|nr:FliA/WhiG family RNA polymerase sigma factor [Thermocrinis minervae]SHK30951.1 RNA polymerase, sigma 28 subunit, SigD/FliA/WhiG [Thermocrinis minervae]